MLSDAELLDSYVLRKDQSAFAELVDRYLGVVYAAAVRRTAGRHHLAEEVAQKVFTRLSQKAASLQHHPALVGWLYRATRYIAIDMMRAERSRESLIQNYETTRMDEMDTKPLADWKKVRPLIDEAIDDLGRKDRDVILLRFFQGLGFAEIGTRLGLSENTTRMRCTRAMEKLRGHLEKRGVVTGGGLAALLTSETLASAPAGLAGSVVFLATTAAAQSTVAVFIAALLAQKARLIGIAVVAGAIGLGAALLAKRPETLRTAVSWVGMSPQQPFADNVVRAVDERLRERSTEDATRSGRGGRSTPQEALQTYARAIDEGDGPTLRDVLFFGEHAKREIGKIHARMSDEVRRRFSTPEDLVAFFFTADALLNPIPPEVFENWVKTESSSDHVMMRSPQPHGGGIELVRTPQGWKCRVPDGFSTVMAQRVSGSPLLARLVNLSPAAKDPMYREQGYDSPLAALETFVGAAERRDVETLQQAFVIDPAALAKAEHYQQSLPADSRSRLGSLQTLAATLLIYDASLRPYPVPEILRLAAHEPRSADRVVLLLPGTRHPQVEFQKTAYGWKYVITEAEVKSYLQENAPHLLAGPPNREP